MNVAFKLLWKVILVCEFALLQFVKCSFGIIDFQRSGYVSLPETTEIIQLVLALTKFYISLNKVRACIFIFSGFWFVSVCRSDKTSASALAALTDISIRCLSHIFSHRDLSIFILHWSLVVKALLRDCTVDILMMWGI